MPFWIIPIAPLIAAIFAGVVALGRGKGAWGSAASLVGIGVSFAGVLLNRVGSGIEGALHADLTWLQLGDLEFKLGVHIDSLTWTMLAVVCLVSLLVQVYSVAYMRGEPGFARYYAYLSLFTASMLGLVVANNLFQLYVCWELVGACSYLLVGFWWHKPAAASAAKKAFVVTRFGDVGFMLGILLVTTAAGSFDFGAAHSALNLGTNTFVSAEVFRWLVPLLLFCGAVGKSAQFPLHIWLPDAMEGPTPVSALIHAATMVAAGVYMVVRLFALFVVDPVVADVVLVIGTATALIAATIALVQFDIKKVMAYSTVSQLGLMMMGLGAVGGWIILDRKSGNPAEYGGQVAAMFHLITHAMFKALLFLAAGSVIHAMHHAKDPNDLRSMGGLLKRMPVTGWCCLIGVLSLAGFPLLSGFWSKDALLGELIVTGGLLRQVCFGIGILVAALTAFYSMRMWLLAFGGEARSEDAAHAKESPWQMTLPLVVLAIPSIALGALLHSGHRFSHWMTGLHMDFASTPLWIAGLATAAGLVGLGLALRTYRKPYAAVDPVLALPGAAVFNRLWGIESFWQTVGARGGALVGRTAAWFDRHVIDASMDGIARSCGRLGAQVRRQATGQVQSAAWIAAAGLALLALLLAIGRTTTAPEPPGPSSVRVGGIRAQVDR